MNMAIPAPIPAPTPTRARAASETDRLRGLVRRRVIDQLVPLIAAGHSYEECSEMLGITSGTLWRWHAKWKEGGDAALVSHYAKCGRRRVAQAEVFGPEAIAFVKRATLQTESLPLALERLSDAGPCSAEARALIDKYRLSGNYPPSFKALFRVTEEEWEKARGERHFDGVTHTARRGMWYVDAQGKRRELFAGDLVEADDVSVDCPYYLALPDGRFVVGRQMLCFRDRRSRKWLGAYPVARERDSYRGEDIARACREVVAAWGVFGRFRFERGAWESAPVSGIKLSDALAGETAGAAPGGRWGGITAVVPVIHVFTSRAKGTIEGGFRMLHKVLGLHGVRIGRHRGEYEQATADMLAVNAGRRHPRDCGFIAWGDLLGALEKTFTLLNTRPVFFQEAGAKAAPDDVWARDMAARPGGRLPALDPALAWHFLPAKSEVGAGIAQAGHVKVAVPGYPLPFFFRIGGPVTVFGKAESLELRAESKTAEARNEDPSSGLSALSSQLSASGGGEAAVAIAPFIERGHRLLVAFDPQRAAEGAVIFNAELGPRNTQAWRPLQKLFIAPLAEEAPQFNLVPGAAAASEDIVARKTRDQQVRAAFTSIGTYGHGARRVRQDHDGRGSTVRVESGEAAPAPEPPKPRSRGSASAPRRIVSVVPAPEALPRPLPPTEDW